MRINNWLDSNEEVRERSASTSVQFCSKKWPDDGHRKYSWTHGIDVRQERRKELEEKYFKEDK